MLLNYYSNNFLYVSSIRYSNENSELKPDTNKLSEFIFFVWMLLFGSKDNFVRVKLTHRLLFAMLDLDSVT